MAIYGFVARPAWELILGFVRGEVMCCEVIDGEKFVTNCIVAGDNFGERAPRRELREPDDVRGRIALLGELTAIGGFTSAGGLIIASGFVVTGDFSIAGGTGEIGEIGGAGGIGGMREIGETG